MKKIVFIAFYIFLFYLNSNYGQESYINVRKLPIPDCSGKTSLWNDFNKNKIKILVIPDSPSDSVEFYRMFNYMKGGFADSLIKRESELTNGDFTNGLEIYGVIKDFKNWSKFGLPIKSVQNGFLFNNKEYVDDSDGIFFISKDRNVYTGNSLGSIWKEQSTYAAYYKYMIFENGLLSKLCISDSAIIDVAKIRESNYHNKSTRYYNIFIDKKLPGININDSLVIDICAKMKLNLPDFRINVFLHNDPNATRLFSNFYFAAGCDTLSHDMKFATVQIDGLQVTGDNIGFVRHETFHYLWSKLVGYMQSGNEFYNEGIEKYYEFLNDTLNFNKSVRIQQKHLDYDITKLVIKGDGQSFWDSPSENNSPIAYDLSGLFVKYLIDNWGLDPFKKFFVQKDVEKAFVEYYKETAKQIIISYNDWIKNKISKLP